MKEPTYEVEITVHGLPENDKEYADKLDSIYAHIESLGLTCDKDVMGYEEGGE